MKNTVLTRRLTAHPFPTLATLLTNAATISAWANSASYFPCWCLPPRPLRPARQMGTWSLSSNVYHQRTHLNRKNQGRSTWVGKSRLNSILSENRELERSEECNNDIVAAVRKSLRYDLVQSHRDDMRSHGIGDDHSTLVLVLAVSGGCDSMALFHAVLSLTTMCDQQQGENDDDGTRTVCHDKSRRWLQLEIENAHIEQNSCRVPCELHVAHFNHEQRGESSDGDCDFVRDRCIEHEVPFHLYSWSDEEESSSEMFESTGLHSCSDTTKTLHDKKSFTQDVARQWRQQKLKELLSRLVLTPDALSRHDSRWGAILTAHHRDDADETIMLKLLRGSHLLNLRSMNAKSDGFNLQLGNRKSSIGYFAKPMLKVRKSHIIQYLTFNSFDWREDDSNNSSKYKRNLVRNELMPLLSEIAGGENALRKRLNNLERQSQEMSNLLSEQSHEYLRSMPFDNKFTLFRDSENVQFNLVQEQALHLWIMKTTMGRLQVSYDQMLRIRDQIQNYPNNLQWTMDLGRHWEIQRNGDTMVVIKGNDRDQPSDSGTLPWIIIAGPGTCIEDFEPRETVDDQEMVELCFGPLPINEENFTINIVRVKDCPGIKFTPSWRQGRSAIKLKDFLRGQSVPLHRRDDSVVLCLSDGESSRHALAVLVEDPIEDGSSKWIVSANFCPRDDLPVTKVVLGKTLNHSIHTPYKT